jgi:hypothetical protein
MTKLPKPIAYPDLAPVCGGLQSHPLGSLSLYIARTQPPSTIVAKSFDVLTLASPLRSVARVATDDAVPRLPALPRRSQWNTPVPKRSMSPMVTAADVQGGPKSKRRRA